MKKNTVREVTLPHFKTYYKMMVIKTQWYWHKDRNTDQWNRIDSPKINLHIMIKWCLTKEPRLAGWWDKWWQDNMKRKPPSPHFTPYLNITSKWIKDLHISAKTIKLRWKHRQIFLIADLAKEVLDRAQNTRNKNKNFN